MENFNVEMFGVGSIFLGLLFYIFNILIYQRYIYI